MISKWYILGIYLIFYYDFTTSHTSSDRTQETIRTKGTGGWGQYEFYRNYFYRGICEDAQCDRDSYRRWDVR